MDERKGPPTLGLEKKTVRLLEWQERWIEDFAQERDRLLQLLDQAGIAGTIVHVGSTSVKGMKAKPIIDIAIGLRTHDEMHKSRLALSDAGWDYVPAANQPGMLFMAKGEGDIRSHHCHLVMKHNQAWDNLVVVRDYLRRFKKMRERYQAAKERAAEKYPGDRIAYAREKSIFFDSFVHGAFIRHRTGMALAAVQRTREWETNVAPMATAARQLPVAGQRTTLLVAKRAIAESPSERPRKKIGKRSSGRS